MEGIRPVARRRGLFTEEVGGELLVYDSADNVACRLNRTALLVWENCDGEHSLEDLAAVLREAVGDMADENMVLMALDVLTAHGLIASGFSHRDEAEIHVSRRRFFRGTAIGGALAVAAPIVYSMVVPSAAAAQSY